VIAFLDPERAVDPAGVHVHTVDTAAVLDVHAVIRDIELGVAARGESIIDHDMTARAPAHQNSAGP
jgi:hypothetical protein